VSTFTAKPEHEVLYQDLAKLLSRHAIKMTSEEMLAIGANMLGKLLAYQDQRTMTRERGLEIIIHNIEMGNQQAVAELMNSKGRA
jgi:sulfur transfer protein SufE